MQSSIGAKFMVFLTAALALLLFATTSGAAQEYPALEGVDSVDAVFDIRSGDPMNVFSHLQLVHQTYNDDAVRSIDDPPDFAVVFMGKSVTLLSQERDSFSEEEKETLRKMDELLASMAEKGIVLEVCLVATDYFGVDPESIAEEITPVHNGWISSIGYQSKGYSLVPVY